MSSHSQNPFSRFQSRWLLLAVVLIFLGLTIGLGMIALIFHIAPNEPLLIYITYIAMFGLFSLWAFVQLVSSNIKLKYVLGRISPDLSWLSNIGLVIATFLFSISAFLITINLLGLVAPNLVRVLLQSVSESSNPKTAYPFLFSFVSAIAMLIVAPITEEFLFRGVLLQRWAVKWGIPTGLILSSLVFGVLHPHNLVGLTIFGLIMGVLYIRTQTLIVPIVCHALNNAIALLLDRLSSGSQQETVTLEQLQSYGWVGLLLMALSAPWLIRFVRRNWATSETVIPYMANAKN